MSDTIQTVRWSLGIDAVLTGHMWTPPGRERPNEVLWNSIRRTGLEQQLRGAFQITDPLWYGLWIDSPLTKQKCTLLHTLFTDVVCSVPRYRENFQEFLDALNRSSDTGEPLNIELAPPGHVDLGWITMFVHCPRCKAEGPVERWQESYSDNPIECPVCGHSYSPADTYSADREYFAESVTCNACNASYRVKNFSEDEISLLEDHHYYREACDELVWLRRVADFYERNPNFEDDIKPHFLMVLDSEDPKVQGDMMEGVPFDEIQLPSHGPLIEESRDWSTDDLEIIDYLRHHHFSLPHRMKGVQESIERLRPVVGTKSVSCAACGGALE